MLAAEGGLQWTRVWPSRSMCSIGLADPPRIAIGTPNPFANDAAERT